MTFVLAFVLGAMIGSFLNVCIWRLPRDESIVSPPSHCPRCLAAIRPWDNVPLLSYALLRGRCRACGAAIAWRYPAVEALAGVLAVLLLWRFGPTPQFAVAAVFVASLIVVSVIDLDHQIIPNEISLPGILVGLVVAAVGYGPPLLDSVVGVLLGGGLLWAVAAGYAALMKREGMGGGDIKLLAMIGAFLGWQGVLVTVILGSLTGSAIGVALIRLGGGDRRAPIPFGPFLAAGAVCALFFGDALIDWYLALAMPG
ncbi:A24 family peptidase [Candidatus Binatia bacterium]|nr:A24 family peptidase [Candidatus Binatia bacterium]